MAPLFPLSWPAWLLLTLVVTQLTILCVTIYLHRSQSHRALTLHPAIAHLARAWLWLSTGMSTQQWVAVHRKHHAFCETVQDPHSPRYKGFWTVLLRGAQLYTLEAKNDKTIQRFSKGAPNDWLEINLYQKLSLFGPVLLTTSNLMLFGVLKGGALSLIQLLWIPFWAAGVINGIAHSIGYRNFESADASKNISPWGIWIGGEELHNNHHAHPTSAKLSYKPGEVDIGWGVIVLLKTLKLATIHKVARPPKLRTAQSDISVELLGTIARQQHQISSWFHQIWSQTVGEHKTSEKLTTAQARLLLNALRNVELGEATLTLLSTRQKLKTLKNQWQALQRLWLNKTATAEDLVQELTKWCERAESSGIAALREFSIKIRSLEVTPKSLN